jgi:hypothetical protein
MTDPDAPISLFDEPKPAPPQRPTGWKSMNYIQRIGCLGLFPFFMLSLIYDGRLSTIFGLMGWTSIFLGYVAGNLWKFRHAVHFWWSVAFACIVHAALLPIYATLIDKMKNAHGQSGKGYMQLSFVLLIAEVLTLLFVLKHVAMWIHHHTRKTPPGNELRPHGR